MLTRSKRKEVEVAQSTHPLINFPVEITTEIFMYCLPETIDLFDPALAPRLLMQVCRRWRQIALFVPKLWVEFRVDVNDTLRSDEMSAILKRSAGLPLRVTLFNHRDEDLQVFGQIRFFARYCHRIERLRVDMSVDALFKLERYWRTKRAKTQFSVLKSLALVDVESGGLELFMFAMQNIQMFSSATVLEHISLGGIPLEGVELSKTNITRFHGTVYSLQEWAQLLRSLPSLIECDVVFDLDPVDDEDLIVPPPLTHDSLTKLELRFAETPFDELAVLDVLSFLTLPALESISLGPGTLSDQLEGLFASLVTGCPRISTLSVAVPPENPDITRCFSLCSSWKALDTVILSGAGEALLISFFNDFADNNSFLSTVRTFKFPAMQLVGLAYIISHVGPGILKRRALEDPRCALETVCVSTQEFPVTADLQAKTDEMPSDLWGSIRELRSAGLGFTIYWRRRGQEEQELMF
ncbi:hypothetical protein HMN09_01166400 [Mycena chlorophos]|uniref:F-box domain-containing protein n=1 Tax=Mycena chlorophos TaxID=658473 RepID=A0A8H6S924_MYCCL|nr:hypothetical protein HMN09_01166400 [Mycena chlorophos]